MGNARFFCAYAVTCLNVFLAFGQIPDGYYDSASGLSGEDLKGALHLIIDEHRELSYSEAYQALSVIDASPTSVDKITAIYSRFQIDASDLYDGGQGWNREHVWPKSLGNFGTSKGAGTDLHHLRAADISTNSARNNRAFKDGGSLYVDKSGQHNGPTLARRGDGVWTWEPPAEVKGDIARMVLYMTTRYEGGDEPDLELTESVHSASSKAPRLGVKSNILRWHFEDPVSEEEVKRNDLIYSNYQGNRNPYIDHPEFVELIWGNADKHTAYSHSEDATLSESHEPSTIQVGTFNLYWLGVEMRHYGLGLRSKEDVFRIADLVINDLDLEVVVFQEVNTSKNGEFDQGKAQSKQQYLWLKERMEESGYRFEEGRSGGSQRIVIAYDSDEVEMLGGAKELPVRTSFNLAGGCRSRGLRKPLAAKFKAGEFDFWLVGVHLKSQRGGDCSSRVRMEQSYDLLNAMNDLIASSSEQDIVIAGDFNAKANDQSIAPFYTKGGYLTQTWNGRRSSESADVSYLVGDFASLIDHILINPEHTGSELIANSTTVLDPEMENYIKLYSDHAPVWTSFSVVVDDD